MILIATDEAGYGPKLGPLVVAVSTWSLPSGFAVQRPFSEAFDVLAKPLVLDGLKIRVDDSKAVYVAQSSDKNSVGYGVLERVTLAGCRWCGLASDHLDLIGQLSPRDHASIDKTPWLAALASESISTKSSAPLVNAWGDGEAQLIGLQARVITADSFNRFCESGMNKSDLLSQTTLELVQSQLDGLEGPPHDSVAVFCDRHGGRRYYAGPLQSVFDGTLVQVIEESSSVSSYRVPYRQGEFTIRFSVKGDSFTPVAFSSMVAKYIREKAMESLNAYFARFHRSPQPLRPTAGYPVDADRFLKDIQPIIEGQGIDLAALVRSR